MADLLDRLANNVDQESSDPQEQRIGVHEFYAALSGLADGQLTRAQLESVFVIPTTGASAAQLDFIINGFQAATDKGRYLNATHAVLMSLYDFGLSKQQIQDWLTAAQQPWS